MIGETLRVKLGTDASWLQQLVDGDNVPVAYTAGAALAARIWPGGTRAKVATPTAAWVAPATGTYLLTIAAAATAGLAAGTYRLEVLVTAGGLTQTAFDGRIELAGTAGLGTLPPAYCALPDLVKLAPWVPALQDPERDEEGFATECGLARTWLEAIIQRHWRGSSNTSFYPIAPGYGSVWRTGRTDPWLQALLDSGGLVASPAVVSCCALHALGLVCRAQLTPGRDNAYAALAAGFLAEADTAASCLSAEVDVNRDGVGDLVIELGSTDTLWG